MDIEPRSSAVTGEAGGMTELCSEEILEGLACRVRRQSSADGRSWATWFAPGLGVLICRQVRGLEGDYDYRLFNIRLGEPPSSLFVVKEGEA